MQSSPENVCVNQTVTKSKKGQHRQQMAFEDSLYLNELPESEMVVLLAEIVCWRSINW